MFKLDHKTGKSIYEQITDGFKEMIVRGELMPGDRVEHEKFGEGTVITSQGNVVTVVFESVGTKKLAKDLAPLKKI